MSDVLELFGEAALDERGPQWDTVLGRQWCPFLDRKCIKVKKSEHRREEWAREVVSWSMLVLASIVAIAVAGSIIILAVHYLALTTRVGFPRVS